MADPQTPLQLPTMPTAGAAATPSAPGAILGGYGRGAASFAPVSTVADYAGAQAALARNATGAGLPPPSAVPALPVTAGTAATPAVAPGVAAQPVVPASLDLKQAMLARAAFDARTQADTAAATGMTPNDVMNRLATQAKPAPQDPLASQIHFVDQNSPRTPASPSGGAVAAPVLTNRDVDAMGAMAPPPKTIQERAGHGLLDIIFAQEAARQEFEKAHALGDPRLISTAQAKIDALDPAKSPGLKMHMDNLRAITNPTLGVFQGEQPAVH